MTVIPKPDMVGFVVADMAATLKFYRLLGIPIPPEADHEAFAEAKVNGYRISWNHIDMVRGFDPEFAMPNGSRLSLAFLCDSATDVDAVYARMTAAGYAGHKAPWDAFWGQRYATIVDPDGNTVDLFAYLAANQPSVLTAALFRQLLREIFEAVSRRDYATAIQHFTEDVKYADPNNYIMRNRAELLRFFEDDGGHEQRTVWHNVLFDEARQVGVAEWTYDGTHRYHGTSWIKLRDGLVSHWREYQTIDKREWDEWTSGTAFTMD